MANVYVEARPKGRAEGSPIEDYVDEDHADHVLNTFRTQRGVRAGGCGCTRKVASITRCRAIMRSRRRCTPSSPPPASPRIARAGCFAPARDTVPTVLTEQPMAQADAWRMIRRRAVAAGIMGADRQPHVSRDRVTPPISAMAALSNTRNRWPRMKARARPSFMTARRTGSRRTRWRGSGCSLGL